MDWAENVITIIGQLPLALDQAGAYVFADSTTLYKYTRLLKSELGTSPSRVAKDKDKLPIIWDLSWSKISINARRLMQLCSLISNEDIPIKLLQGGKRDIDWMKGTTCPPLPETQPVC